MKILWHWSAMGPYHFARMSALAREPGVTLRVIETTCNDEHKWERLECHKSESQLGFELVTLTDHPWSRRVDRETAEDYYQAIQQFGPDVIVESGYAEPHSRTALFRHRCTHPEILMLLWSETAAFDHNRVRPIEMYKSFVLSHFHGALVAGTPHLRYLSGLGMSPECITPIGGAVDNEFFGAQADAHRASGAPAPIPAPYFLYVGRFIPVKNLQFLLRAFHLYRVLSPGMALDLVLVGSGMEEPKLRSLVSDLRLDGVHFAGNKQVSELPAYYASASAFVLPSLSEPWGLVVNEAMASGLPVLASTACGSAEDLIIPGQTGLLFDPRRTEELAGCFAAIASDLDRAAGMGTLARRKATGFSLPLFASRAAFSMRQLRNESAKNGRVPGTLTNVLGNFERALY